MSLYVQVGAAELPASPDLITKSIREATDPAHEVIIGLLTTALNTELQAAYDVVKGSTPLDGYVVNTAVYFDPTPVLAKGQKLKFPMLSVHRESSQIQKFTIEKARKITTWKIHFALGELSLADMGKIKHLLEGVENVIIETIERGGHPEYMDGYRVLSSECKFYSAQISQSQYGHWETITGGDSLIEIPVIVIDMITHETSKLYDPGYPNAEGLTVRQHVGPVSNEITDFVVSESEHAAEHS